MASGSDIRAGGAFVDLYTKGEKAVEQNLKALQARIQGMAKSVAYVSAGLAAAAAAITGPMLYGASVAGEWGGEISSASRRAGIGFEQVQTLAGGLGTDLEGVVSASHQASNFLSQLANGSEEARRAMGMLSLDSEELISATPEERVRRLHAAISNLPDQANRDRLSAMTLGNANLNFNGGQEGLEQRESRQREVGILGAEEQPAIDAYNRSVRESSQSMRALWASIGMATLPTLTSLVNTFVDGAIEVRKFINENRETLSIVFQVAGAVGAGAAALGIMAGAVHTAAYAIRFLNSMFFVSKIAIGLWKAVLIGAKLVMLGYSAVVAAGSFIVSVFTGATWASLIPLALLVIAIGAVVAAGFMLATAFSSADIGAYFGEWTPILQRFGDTAREVFTGIGDAIAAGEWALAASIAWAGIRLVWARGVNWLRDGWFSFSYMFMLVWDQMAAGAAHAVINIASSVVEVYYGIANTIAEIFARIYNTIENAMIRVIGFFARQINRLVGLIPETIRTQVGIARVDFDEATERSAAEQRQQAAATERANQQQAGRENRAQVTQAAHNAVDTTVTNRERQRAREMSEERARAREEEAGIQGELDQGTEQAWIARAMREQDTSRWNIADRGRDGFQQQAQTIVQGTFSARAASGFAGANPNATLEGIATEQRDLIRELVNQIARNGGIPVMG